MKTNKSRVWPIAGTTAGYMLIYLFVIGDIGFGHYGWHWQAVSSPLTRMMEMRAAFHFEAVAMAELGRAVILISPGNLFVSAILGSLLAANILGALDLRHSECRLPGRYSISAGALPALLAGGACCAPGIVLLLGLPGLGAFIGLFAWLVPLSVILLLINRRYQRRMGAKTLLFSP
ncbi:MAG: hypothetical protein WD750_11350 [Gammaproteobacteria bacterium]